MVEPGPLESAIAGLDQATLDGLARAAGPALTAAPRLLPGARGRHRTTAAGIEFEQLAAYTQGDDVRAVDWRASARAPQPQVRRYRDERAADWYLVLDCSSSMVTPTPRKWLRAAQSCLALAWLALRRGDRAALVLVGEEVLGLCPPGRGGGHFRALIATLRRHGPLPAPAGIGSRPGNALAVIRSPATVVLASDLLRADAMAPDLARLATAADHLRLLQIQDPDDVTLPDSPFPVPLEDAEDGAVYHVADLAGARHNLEAYNARLAAWCRRRGVACSHHHATTAFPDIVLQHLGTAGPVSRGLSP